MSNIVYIATSLDGYIARKDGSLDWLNDLPNPDKSDFGFVAFMDTIDALVMGKNTFEMVMSFGEWPYAKPVFVLSNSLNTIPKGYEDKAELISGDLHAISDTLKSRGYTRLYIDGGGTIQSFLRQDLIDELIITRAPILLGSGIPLFTEMKHSLTFEHIHTEVFNNTLVKSHYKRLR